VLSHSFYLENVSEKKFVTLSNTLNSYLAYTVVSSFSWGTFFFGGGFCSDSCSIKRLFFSKPSMAYFVNVGGFRELQKDLMRYLR
jgi:hypothetical protein